ncbi:hypothetical protein LTR84_007011 [Exophiala bonariae]|uniref:Uncharacterized protein n=1 Tax=Exophiala bonariae TaxID=1690606 RepID=A0AAV9N2T0_9EURO|nr:hypothetical protein LTR84_007011 [Exophiala bonariae]
MVHKILFWAGFGIATRFLQLGIEMRPFFQRGALWVYPLFAGVGGSFGYWMKGVEDRQFKLLQQRKEILLEKRRRRAERDALADGGQAETAGVLASTS